MQVNPGIVAAATVNSGQDELVLMIEIYKEEIKSCESDCACIEASLACNFPMLQQPLNDCTSDELRFIKEKISARNELMSKYVNRLGELSLSLSQKIRDSQGLLDFNHPLYLKMKQKKEAVLELKSQCERQELGDASILIQITEIEQRPPLTGRVSVGDPAVVRDLTKAIENAEEKIEFDIRPRLDTLSPWMQTVWTKKMQAVDQDPNREKLSAEVVEKQQEISTFIKDLETLAASLEKIKIPHGHDALNTRLLTAQQTIEIFKDRFEILSRSCEKILNMIKKQPVEGCVLPKHSASALIDSPAVSASNDDLDPELVHIFNDDPASIDSDPDISGFYDLDPAPPAPPVGSTVKPAAPVNADDLNLDDFYDP